MTARSRRWGVCLVLLVTSKCGQGAGESEIARPTGAALATATPSVSAPPTPTHTPKRVPQVARAQSRSLRPAEPPFAYKCPTAPQWRRAHKLRQLPKCSKFKLPERVSDDMVELKKGTPVVFLGIDHSGEMDRIVVGLPEGFHDSFRVPSGTVRVTCGKWSAHRFQAAGWGPVLLKLGWVTPVADAGPIPKRFGCRMTHPNPMR